MFKKQMFLYFIKLVIKKGTVHENKPQGGGQIYTLT